MKLKISANIKDMVQGINQANQKPTFIILVKYLLYFMNSFQVKGNNMKILST